MDRLQIISNIVSSNMELVEEDMDLLCDLEDVLIEAISLESNVPIHTGECKNKLESAECLFLNAIYMNLVEVVKSLKNGNLTAANMLLRSVFENYMLMTAITKHHDLKLAELWELNSICEKIKYLKDDSAKIEEDLKNYVDNLGLNYYSIDWKNLRGSYGWLYPLIPNKSNRNLYKLCEIIETTDDYNHDYRLLCEFVHGGSLFQKEGRFAFYSAFLAICSIFIKYLDYIVESYSLSSEYYDQLSEYISQRILELLEME